MRSGGVPREIGTASGAAALVEGAGYTPGMPLNNERDNWLQRATHAMKIAESLAAGLPTDDPRPVRPSAVEGLREALRGELGQPDDPSPENPVLAEVIRPLIDARDDLLCTSSYPGEWPELLGKMKSLSNVARTARQDLLSNEDLSAQSVDEIVDDLAREFRMSMFLCLTANQALSQQVNEWRKRRSDGLQSGDYLDMLTFDFVGERSSTTVSMHDLADNSTGRPFVAHPGNLSAELNALMKGKDPAPPLYRMAYGQWFISIFAAWDEFYRPSLAAAHNRVDPDAGWCNNDIRSDFFGEIRLIRHDFVHNKGVCKKSKEVKLVEWLSEGQPIAPSPAQMMALLEQFPEEELRQAPMKQPEPQSRQLQYHFDAAWAHKLEAHVSKISPVKRERPAVVQLALDEWMKRGQEDAAR